MPERSVAGMLGHGRLAHVLGMPEFDYRLYARLRRNAVEVDMGEMVATLRQCFST